MMYQSAVEQVVAQVNKSDVHETYVRLGSVTGVQNGQAVIQFYGDNIASDKRYSCIDGYFPETGDKVALISQGNTWIVLGKIINTAPVRKYADKDHNHDELYLPLDYANKLVNGSVHLSLNSTALIPNSNGSVSLGSSSAKLNGVYTNHIYINGTEFIPFTSVDNIQMQVGVGPVYKLQLVNVNSNPVLQPNGNGTISIGSGSYHIKNIVANKLQSDWYYNAESTTNTRHLSWTSLDTVAADANNAVNLGASTRQFKAVYANNLYANGTAVTSDRRKKKSIKDLTRKYVDFFRKLRPVSFKYKAGESDRTHTGFIAQEVETAANECGIDTKDMAAVVIDESGNYALRYDELIAVQTKVIQELLERVEALERGNKLTEGDTTK